MWAVRVVTILFFDMYVLRITIFRFRCRLDIALLGASPHTPS
jgi:hypothetical protein